MVSQRSKPVAPVSSPLEILHRSTVLLCMLISSVTVFADQGFCLLLLKERPFDFYLGQEVHADQRLWFKLHKKRPFDFNRGGLGKMSRKKKSKTFSKKISRT